MNNEMKKSIASMDNMFKPEEFPKKTAPVKIPRWFYITRNRDQEMLLSFDSNGRPIWCPHDLQYTIPHMFTSSQKASRKSAEIGGHNVRMSRYQKINGKSVWTKA